MLNFPSEWRFRPPAAAIPDVVVSNIFSLIQRTASQQGQDQQRQRTLECFKSVFAPLAGVPNCSSSSASWAETDLHSFMQAATANAPLFIEAFYNGWETSRDLLDLAVPDTAAMNDVLAKHGVPFRIEPPNLTPVEGDNPAVVIPVPNRPPTLAEQGADVFQRSLQRSEQLLNEGHDREAVQVILFLLESVATAFRDLDTEEGQIGGKYFNRIVRDLRQAGARPALDHILRWLTNMHGYLSAPAGGGVRHGLDLNQGVEITHSEARLYCNLTRSYLNFLLAEHRRLVASQGATLEVAGHGAALSGRAGGVVGDHPSALPVAGEHDGGG